MQVQHHSGASGLATLIIVSILCVRICSSLRLGRNSSTGGRVLT